MSQQFGYEEQVGNFEPGVSASRAEFIGKTYSHLFGSMCLFTVTEIIFFRTGMAESIAGAIMSLPWLLILGMFMLVGWFSSSLATRIHSVPAQYAALFIGVMAWALMFVPMLFIANTYAPGVITSAASVTLVGFAGLTGIAFISRKDFSFLGSFLKWIGLCALLGIGASLIFGFALGTWFSVAMVAFAGAAILYDTSNVIRNYPEDMHVAAALQLFGSVALMFWYVLQIFMSRD